MLKFPYGIANFPTIRTDGLVYVDRTNYLPVMEALGRILVFLRPRRFGKSLWLQTLASYYDVGQRERFDAFFGDLVVGQNPTPLRNRYLILRWNFSYVNPTGDTRAIAEDLREHIQVQAQEFIETYSAYVHTSVSLEGSINTIIRNLLRATRKSGHKVYLLVDEYDNFINEVMTRDPATYHALVESDGPFKSLFKSVKGATEDASIDRVFMTGVAPMALNDLTSGFNVVEDVTHAPNLAGLCGFTTEEVQALLARVVHETSTSLDLERLADMLRIWYNGYQFARDDGPLVYNPTNTLYFLKYLATYGKPPEQLYDENLRTDQNKLIFLMDHAPGTSIIEDLAEQGESPQPVRLAQSFSLRDLTTGLRKDDRIIASFLYYIGLVTHKTGTMRLRIPNLVIRKLFLERLLALYLPHPPDFNAAYPVQIEFFETGNLQPVLDFLETKLLPVLSNRDRGSANELVLKSLLLATLFDDYRYQMYSEAEVNKGYVDLCLIRRPEMRTRLDFDVLLELKLVSRKAVGTSAQALRDMSETELFALSPVQEAFIEAKAQLYRYASDLPRDFNLKCFALVAVGLDRVLAKAVPRPARSRQT